MEKAKESLLLTHWCMIRNNRLYIDDKVDHITENFSNFAAFLKDLYKKEQLNYPKFFKMDLLSKLGFLTAERLIKESDVLEFQSKEETGIIIFNSSACLETDTEYQKTIQDKSAYFPSPSVFVYTLPNILIGEICIRHKFKGDNAFLVSEKFNPELIHDQVSCLMESDRVQVCMAGWVEVLADHYESLLFLVEKRPSGAFKPFTSKIINDIYHINEA